jgi:hypothetical protein
MTLDARRSILTAALAAALLAGCASVPKAAPELDLAAKQFQPPKPGLAAVYVYRNEAFGAAARMSVLLNGQLVGDTASRSFLYFWVGPGKHQLVSKAENDSALDLEAKAGATYFVWQEMKMGVFGPRSKLQLVDEATGKAGVAECSLVDTGPAPGAAPVAPAAVPAAAPVPAAMTR